MSTILNKKYIEAGSPLNAADLNAPYDLLASDTIDAVNTADKWANRDFINEVGPDLNKLYHDYNNGAIPFSTSSTTDVVVTNGGDQRIINVNYTCDNDVLVRIWADGTTGIPTWEAKDFAGGNPQNNQWQVSIWIVTNGGIKTRVNYGNFSFSAYSNVTLNGAPASSKTINYRNFGISGVIPLPSGTVIDQIQLLAKVGNAGNTLVIGRNNLFAVVVEN